MIFTAVCGGDIEVDISGHLESPNYPDDYQPNKLCIWKLSVPEVSEETSFHYPNTNDEIL